MFKSNLDNLQPADPTPEPGPGEAGQPYDSRANTDQVWSDGSTVRNNPQFAFDGDTTTRAIPVDPDDLLYPHTESFAFSSIDVTQSLELWVGTGNNSTNGGLVINGTDASDQLGSKDSTGAWVTITGFDSLSSIGLTRKNDTTYTSLFAVRVDGRLLVDQGVWNNSQNWSSDCEGDAERAKMAFDGDLSRQSYGLGNDEIAWLPPGGIAFQTLRVYGRAEAGNVEGIKYTLQGQAEVSITATDIAAWFDIPGPGTLTKLRWTRGGPASSALVGGIELDGALLVDSGAQWNTSQVWSNLNNGTWQEAFPLTNAFNGVINSSESEGGADFYGAKPTFGGVYASVGPIPTKVTTGADKDISELEIDIYITASVPQDAILWNGGNIGSIPSTAGVHKLKKTINTTSTVTLEFKADTTSQYAYLRGITACYADGSRELLVDGTAVWNTSEVWSDGITSVNWDQNTDWTSLFDGDPNNLGNLPDISNPAVWVPPGLITCKKFRLKYWEQGVAGNYPARSVKVTIDGQETTLPSILGEVSGGKSKWVTVFDGSEDKVVSNVTWTTVNGADYIRMDAMEADGALLVDGAIPWNSSQVWSDAITFQKSGIGINSIGNMFDGNLTTLGGCLTDNLNNGTNNVLEFTFNQPIAVSSSVTLVTLSNENHKTYSVNSLPGVNASTSPNEIKFNFSGTLDSITASTTWEGTNNLSLAGIIVDGEILVDAGFGSNGFYLPFDPAQTGAKYSSYGTGSPQGAKTWSMAFDGKNNTKIGNNTESITWDITSAPITVTDKVEVRALSASGNAAKTNFKVNGVDIGAVIGNDSWYTVSGPVILNTLTWGSDPNDNSKSTDVGAIRIDGSVLVDHSSIGVDMSGNNNNFHDQNFGIGDSSQVWSKNFSRNTWIN